MEKRKKRLQKTRLLLLLLQLFVGRNVVVLRSYGTKPRTVWRYKRNNAFNFHLSLWRKFPALRRYYTGDSWKIRDRNRSRDQPAWSGTETQFSSRSPRFSSIVSVMKYRAQIIVQLLWLHLSDLDIPPPPRSTNLPYIIYQFIVITSNSSSTKVHSNRQITFPSVVFFFFYYFMHVPSPSSISR